MTTIQIKRCHSGHVLYECETPADMAACLHMRHALEQDLDRDRAASVYDADLHHLALLAGEPKGPTGWIRLIAMWAVAIALAPTIIFLSGCTGPSAQQEAEDVADDAATAQLQAAIDARCHSRAVHERLACAVDALAEMQPERWMPEDVQRGHQAAQMVGSAQ